MEIKKYKKENEKSLIELIKREGSSWNYYISKKNLEKYKKSLLNSITYIAYEKDILCGYSRSLNDNGFCIYICDLLIDKEYRGNKIGKKLIEEICIDYPSYEIYVMSDIDNFYIKKGYIKQGSVFKISK